MGVSVFVKFISIVVAILISRWENVYFNPDLLKDVKLTLAYLGIILGFINFGIPQIIYKLYTNESNQDKLNDIWTTFFIFRIISYFFGIFVILITFSFFRVNNLFMVLGLYSMQFILLTDQNYRSVVDSRDKSYMFSVTDLIGKILVTLSLYIGIQYFTTDLNILQLFIFSGIATYLLIYLLDSWVNRIYTKFTSFKWDILKDNFNALLYLTLPGLLIMGSLDRIFLDYFGANKFAFNGYSNALKVLEIAVIFPNIIIPTLTSRLKIQSDSLDKEQKADKLNRYILYLFVLGIFYALIVAFLSPYFFKLIDPKNLFSNYSLEVMWIFSIYLATIFLTTFHQYINYLHHKEILELKIHIFHYVLFVGLYVILIPKFGIVGASVTYLISSVINLTSRFYIFKFKI